MSNKPSVVVINKALQAPQDPYCVDEAPNGVIFHCLPTWPVMDQHRAAGAWTQGRVLLNSTSPASTPEALDGGIRRVSFFLGAVGREEHGELHDSEAAQPS